MKWETKGQLAKALNNGNNKKVCDIILSNEMDMQAWDMFVFGMNLNKSDDYMSLYHKLLSVEDEYIKQAGIRAILRFRYLLSKLGKIDRLMAKKEFEIGEVFQCGLVKLKVVKQEKIGTCTGCALNRLEYCTAVQEFVGSCYHADREDNTDIVFVKVEEEP